MGDQEVLGCMKASWPQAFSWAVNFHCCLDSFVCSIEGFGVWVADVHAGLFLPFLAGHETSDGQPQRLCSSPLLSQFKHRRTGNEPSEKAFTANFLPEHHRIQVSLCTHKQQISIHSSGY